MKTGKEKAPPAPKGKLCIKFEISFKTVIDFYKRVNKRYVFWSIAFIF